MNKLQTQLNQIFAAEEDYLPVLRTLAVVGVAESVQLQQASGLSRDKLRRTLEKLQTLGAVHALRQDIRRRLGRGRSPRVWRLEQAGAALLKTRPGQLTDERTITHALGMLDFHLCAQRDNLEIATDRQLKFPGGVIRPDHRVTLPGGRTAIFEIEQDASPRLLRRITTSLRHKQRFFSRPGAEAVSPLIRMLVALPAGTAFERTLGVWQQALDILQSEIADEKPAFQLAAMPLAVFLDQPDWDVPPESRHWVWLTGEGARHRPRRWQRFLDQVPQRSPLHDRLILAALLRELHHNPALGRKVRPNPGFFEAMQIIHAASHAPGLPPLARAAYPWESLFLLRHYLHLHPALRKQINRRIRASAMQMRWNTTIILHRMQTVVDDFLGYHGWRSDGLLLAYPETAPWDQETVRSFQVRVRIRDAAILRLPEARIPTRQEVETAGQALAWTLTALFRYAPDVGFKSPPFW